MFVYGAQFHRPPNPPRPQRRRDIENFRKLGLITVKLWCPWNWLNPAEGVYEFEELIEITEYAAEAGLQVLVRQLTHRRKSAWIVMNPTDGTVEETLALPKDAKQAIDLDADQYVKIVGRQIQLQLEANSAKCIMFD